uniref:Uncharacterized protein n=1 Tax=Anguilla anguilla TaxID=7936 RepID=A0A0E9VTM3_ANGAN
MVTVLLFYNEMFPCVFVVESTEKLLNLF